MKNGVVFLLLLAATAMTTWADPVDPQRAARVAKGFGGAMGVKEPAGWQLTGWQYSNLYLFASPQGGWVVVSTDDCTRPVLAYSPSSTLDAGRLPAAVQNLMDAYDREVACVAAAGGAVNAEWTEMERGEWRVESGKEEDVGPLLTTTWFQMSPYNMYCPTGCMTGCVATAMAQVMRYWGFPAFGRGSHTYSDDTGYGPLSADFGHTRYDWDNMPNRLTAASSTDEKRAVATLMYHCGVAVDMHYGSMESGSTNEKAAEAFSTWFRYQPTRHLYKGAMSNDEWTDTLIAELRHRRPILYGGNGPAGGHCFVCDGFNAQRYLHFNMGEDGEADGFYLIGAIGSGMYSFNQSNDAVLGICPVEGPYVNEERLGFTRESASAPLWVGLRDTAVGSCTAVCDVDWITLSESSPLQMEVEVRVSENTTGDTRRGIVTFSQNGLTATVEVEQQAYDPATDYCPLTVVMENTHNEPWADDAHLSFESPSGFMYGTASHTTYTGSSTAVVSVAPHDVLVRWHGGGARDRYINYRIMNSYGEVIVEVQNAYFDGADVLIEWPCSPLGVDAAETSYCRVWPNPTTGLVNIAIGEDMPMQVVLFDATGRELLRTTGSTLDLTGFADGVYYVRVVTTEGIRSTKLVKNQ